MECYNCHIINYFQGTILLYFPTQISNKLKD